MTDITKRLAEALRAAKAGLVILAARCNTTAHDEILAQVKDALADFDRTAAQEANVQERTCIHGYAGTCPAGCIDPTPAPASGEVFNILLGMRARLASYRDDGSVNREAGFWLMQEIGTALTIEAATRTRQGERKKTCTHCNGAGCPYCHGEGDVYVPTAADAEAYRAQIIWCSPKDTPQIGVGADKSFIVCVQRASGKQYVFGATYANQFEIEWDDFRDSDKAEASGNSWRCEVGEDHDHATGWFVDDGQDGTRYMPLLSSDDILIAWAAYPPPPIGAVIPTAAPVPAEVDCVRCGNRHSGGC